jgi:hypothetical protein
MNEAVQSAPRPRPRPRWAAPLIGVVAVAVLATTGFRFGVPFTLLGVAALALLGVIFGLLRSIQALASPPDDPWLDQRSHSPAEERKRAALQAIKDLEYEKSIGNVGDEDYRTLLTRYREEAKASMRAVDDERRERREKAERLAREAVAANLDDDDLAPDRREGAEADSEGSSSEGREREDAAPPTEAEVPRKKKRSGDGKGGSARPRCPKCSTRNDPDARFCKKCGGAMGATEEGAG